MREYLLAAGAIVGIVAAFYMIKYVTVFMSLLRLPYWPTKTLNLVWPPHFDTDEKAAIYELMQLGFAPITTDRVNMGPLSSNCLIFENRDQRSFAFLSLFTNITTGFTVEFFSYDANDQVLSTVNRAAWFITDKPASVSIEDALAPSLDRHWAYHKARISQATLKQPDIKYVHDLVIDRLTATLPSLIDKKYVVKGKDDTWYPTFLMACRLFRDWYKVKDKLAIPYRTVLTLDAADQNFFVKAYNHIEIINQAKKPQSNVTVGIGIVTLAISFGIWGNMFDWEYACILIGVLFVHELGHALAMRAFGYSDISMFFVPFFGAAVTGTAKDMAAWKQAIVLLAGPIPGLLVALGFFIYRGLYPFEASYDLGQIAIVAGFINLFNLLPLTPLDGGRLLDLAIFARWPRARLGFAALSIIGFLGLAVWQQDVLFVPIVILFGLSLIYQYSLIDVQLAWKNGSPPKEQLLNLYRAAKKSFGPKSYMQYYKSIKTVFEQRKVRLPQLWESVAVLSIMIFIWSGVAIAAYHFMPKQRYLSSVHQSDRRTADQKAFDIAVDIYENNSKDDRSLNEIENVAARLPASDERHVDLEVMKALLLPIEESAPLLENMLREHRVGIANDTWQLAGLWMTIVYQSNAYKSSNDQIEPLRQAIDKVKEFVPDQPGITSHYRIKLAELIAKNGNAAEALNILEATRAELAQTNQPFLVSSVVQAEAWLSLDQNKPVQAVALLKNARDKELKGQPEQLSYDYAWALFFAGDVSTAISNMFDAAYMQPVRPTFLQNALGTFSKPRLVRPLDLASFMIKEKKMDEVRALIEKEAPTMCRRKPVPSSEPWHEQRDRVILSTYQAVCQQL